MKNVFLTIVCAYSLFPTSLFSAEAPIAGDTKVYSSDILRHLYLPRVLRPLQFGCTLAEFKKIEPNLKYIDLNTGSNLTAAVKSINNGDIKEVAIFFRRESPHYSSQMIVTYESDLKLLYMTKALLGETVDLKEGSIEGATGKWWKATQEDNNSIIAYNSGNLDVIYSIYKDEWYEEPKPKKKVAKWDLIEAKRTQERTEWNAENGINTTSAQKPKKGYSVSQIGTKPVKQSAGYTYVSWKCLVRNKTNKTQTADVTFKFMDKSGYLLSDDLKYKVVIPARQSVKVSETTMLKSHVWHQVKKHEVEVKFR